MTLPENNPDSPPNPPAGEEQPGERWVEVRFQGVRPYVTYTLLAITILTYISQEASTFLTNGEIDLPLALGANISELILQGQIWRLLTPMLLHFSIIHIGGNIYSLYALGPNLEFHYGHWRFLALYLLAGFAGNAVSFVFLPSNAIAAGASTAIFGLIGAYGVLLYHNRELLGKAAQQGLTNVVTVTLINLVFGFTLGLDNWGHIGGLIGGAAFAWLCGPIFKVRGLLPDLRLEDVRTPADAWRAGVSLAAAFTLLTAAAIFWKLV